MRQGNIIVVVTQIILNQHLERHNVRSVVLRSLRCHGIALNAVIVVEREIKSNLI